MPLGLAVLAAHLREHEVKIYDPNVSDNPFDELPWVVNNFSPNLIGFSLRNIDTTKYDDQFLYFNHFKEFIHFVKTISGDSIFTVGGAGFSLFPEQVMKSVPEIKFGFYLESENSFKTFIEAQFNPEGIPGIYYRGGEGIELTGIPELCEIDDQPYPAWDLLNISNYTAYSDRAAIGVEGKRGCAMKCTYCTYPGLAGSKVRMKPVKMVVDEIEILRKKYGVRRISFTDPVFNFPPQHAEDICKQLIERKIDIQWTAYHQDRYLSAEYIKLARGAGCLEFYISSDSASKEGLKALGKSGTVDTLYHSLKLIKADTEAKAAYNFYAAVPGTGWHNFIAAIIFIIKAKIKLKKRLSRFRLSYIRIEPGTLLAKSLTKKQNLINDIIPVDAKQLNKTFYRKSTSFLLNIILAIHYYTGKIFGRHNLIVNP